MLLSSKALAGPKRMVDGKLQPSSLDVYIAMEYGSDGDLFNLRCLPIAHIFVAWPKHNGERGLPSCKAAQQCCGRNPAYHTSWLHLVLLALLEAQPRDSDLPHLPLSQRPNERRGGVCRDVAAASGAQVPAPQQCLAQVSGNLSHNLHSSVHCIMSSLLLQSAFSCDFSPESNSIWPWAGTSSPPTSC